MAPSVVCKTCGHDHPTREECGVLVPIPTLPDRGWPCLCRRGSAGTTGGQRRIPKRVRDEVIARDGQTCWACGRVCSSRTKRGRLTLDHIVPWSKGGLHEASNLRVMCASCNSARGNRENWVPCNQQKVSRPWQRTPHGVDS